MRGLLQDYTSKFERKNPSLTPLIDVVFQLILFFLVTSSFTWYSGMKVNLPEATSAVMDRPPETITLEITRGEEQAATPEILIVRWWEERVEGELFWPPAEDQDPALGLANLKARLEEHKNTLTEDQNPSVVIAAEDSVPYQIVVTVIDMCEQLKLSEIVLAIQKKASDQ